MLSRSLISGGTALLLCALGLSGPACAEAGKTVAASMSCSGTTVEIQCQGAKRNDGSADCSQTSIRLEDANGQFTRILKPAELSAGDDSNTAASMACSQGNDGASYIIVVYGGLPYGCSFCEWFYVYDLKGQQLTKSEPLTETDDALPEGKNVGPNNSESAALIEKLGLKIDDRVSVQCDRELSSDEPSCIVK